MAYLTPDNLFTPTSENSISGSSTSENSPSASLGEYRLREWPERRNSGPGSIGPGRPLPTVLWGFPSRKMRAHASPRTPRYPPELVLCRYRLSHRHLAQARLVQHDDAARPRRLDESRLPELAHGLGDGLARARHHAGEVVVAQAHPQSPPPATLLPEALR